MAENQNTTKIVDLKIKGAEALDTIAKLTEELDKNKKRLKELNEVEKENNGLSREQKDEKVLAIAASKQLQKEINQQTNVLKNNVAQERAAAGSLKDLRAQYNTLKTTYEELSETQREALIPQMMEIKQRIEQAGKAVGDYSSIIGNYEGAITNALPGFGKFQKVIQGLGIDANATAKVMAQNVVTSLRAVGNSMKALMANPLIAGIAALLATILAIREAIQRNQQAMDALQRVFAPFRVLVDALFVGLGKVIGAIAEGIAKVTELFVKNNKVMDESIKAQKTLQQLREAEIADIEETAAGNRRIAELKENIARRDKFTAEERRKFAEEVKREIEIQMKGEIDRANLRLKAFEQENSNRIRLNRLTAEERRQYAELKAAIDNVTAANLERGKQANRVLAETNAAIEAEKQAVKKAEEDKRKTYAETARRRRELELTINQQLEDIANSLITSQREREVAEAETRFNRQIQSLRKQLNEEKNLTKSAREDLNSVIILLEQRKNAEISRINEAFTTEEFNRQVEERNKELEQEAQFRQQQLEYFLKQKADAAALELEQRRQQLNDAFAFEVEQAQREAEFLKNIDEETKDKLYETQEAYELAVLRSNERLSKANSNLRREEIQKAQDLLANLGSVAGAMSDLFGELAGQSKSMQSFQRALGSVQILSDMAVGIAGAIKAGAGVPFPANLAAIASGVGTVVAGITSAITLFRKGQEVQIPSNLRGGRSASVSTPGISPVSPQQFSPAPTYGTTTLNLGSSDTGIRGVQSGLAGEIREAIREAYSEIPAPVVRVSDIQSVSEASGTIKSISVI